MQGHRGHRGAAGRRLRLSPTRRARLGLVALRPPQLTTRPDPLGPPDPRTTPPSAPAHPPTQALTGLRTLYLESNAIAAIQGLEQLTNLRSLYLGRNLIDSIQGLEQLALLETLDLSENRIARLQVGCYTAQRPAASCCGSACQPRGRRLHRRPRCRCCRGSASCAACARCTWAATGWRARATSPTWPSAAARWRRST
jgi:hypothetical protein